MSEKKKSRWPGRLVRIFILLCVLAAILVGVGKFWVLPSLVRSMAQLRLEEVWHGTVTIDEVQANLFEPSRVSGVTVRDESDKRWLAVKSLSAELAWDGWTPRIVAVAADGVSVSPRFVNGRFTIPIKPQPQSDEPLDIAAIVGDFKDVNVTVRDISIKAVNEDRTASRPQGSPAATKLDAVLAELLSDITIPEIKWQGGKLAADGIRANTTHGKIDADLQGGIRDDESFALSGKAASSVFDGRTQQSVDCEFKLGGYGKITAAVTGNAFRGSVRGDLSIVINPDTSKRTLKAEALVSDISMAALTRVLSPEDVMEQGTGKAVLELDMSGERLDELRVADGAGAFFLDDAHVWRLPILSALFEHMKLKLGKADVQISFEVDRSKDGEPLATVQAGQLATLVWAADFLKGGAVNLRSGEIDGDVVFVPIKQAGLLTNVLGAINPLRLVTREIFRLHVTGTTKEPKITPKPFSKVAELSAGTLGLLKSAAKSGGQLTGDFVKAVTGQ